MTPKKSIIGSECGHTTNGVRRQKIMSKSESIEKRIQKGESFNLQDLEGIKAKPTEYFELIKEYVNIQNKIYKVLCLDKQGKEK